MFVTELKRLRRSQSITRAGPPLRAVDEAAEIAARQAAAASRRGLRRSRQRTLAAAALRAAHRSTRATRRLYQFMKAEKSRLMVRKTAITMMMISTSLPDWFITVPAKIWKISG